MLVRLAAMLALLGAAVAAATLEARNSNCFGVYVVQLSDGELEPLDSPPGVGPIEPINFPSTDLRNVRVGVRLEANNAVGCPATANVVLLQTGGPLYQCGTVAGSSSDYSMNECAGLVRGTIPTSDRFVIYVEEANGNIIDSSPTWRVTHYSAVGAPAPPVSSNPSRLRARLAARREALLAKFARDR